MEYPDVLNGPAAPDSVAAPMPDPVKQALDMEAEDFLKRCVQAKVEDLPITFSLQHHPVTVPACLIRFAALSVLFRLDRAHKWQAALGTWPKDKMQRKRAIKETMARRFPALNVTLKTADALGILCYARQQATKED